MRNENIEKCLLLFNFSGTEKHLARSHRRLKMQIYLLLVLAAVLHIQAARAPSSSEITVEPDPAAQDDDSDHENDTSRKVIGSRYVSFSLLEKLYI